MLIMLRIQLMPMEVLPSAFVLFEKKWVQKVSVNSPISVEVALTPFRGVLELTLIFGDPWLKQESKIGFC